MPQKVYQYHKANNSSIKPEAFKFSQAFLNENPYQRSVEDNWSIFKETMHDINNRNIPTKLIKSHKDLPWLNHSIKRKMKRRNHLYIRAKRTQSIFDWTAYKQLKNEINNLMSKAHEDYCKHLFDNSFCESCKRFWSIIKSLRKIILVLHHSMLMGHV